MLHQQHGADSRIGIDPELRIVDAGPAQAAGRSHGGRVVFGGDLEPQSERVGARAQREGAGHRRIGRRHDFDAQIADMVLRHQVDGVRSKEPNAVVPETPVQDQPHEPGVIPGGGEQSTVAAHRHADGSLRIGLLDQPVFDRRMKRNHTGVCALLCVATSIEVIQAITPSIDPLHFTCLSSVCVTIFVQV